MTVTTVKTLTNGRHSITQKKFLDTENIPEHVPGAITMPPAFTWVIHCTCGYTYSCISPTRDTINRHITTHLKWADTPGYPYE